MKNYQQFAPKWSKRVKFLQYQTCPSVTLNNNIN